MKMPVAALKISPSVAHLGFNVEGLKIFVSTVQFCLAHLSDLRSDFYLGNFPTKVVTSLAGSLSSP